jgi:hypothetical protein
MREKPKRVGGFQRKLRQKDEYIKELQMRVAELEYQLWLTQRS